MKKKGGRGGRGVHVVRETLKILLQVLDIRLASYPPAPPLPMEKKRKEELITHPDKLWGILKLEQKRRCFDSALVKSKKEQRIVRACVMGPLRGRKWGSVSANIGGW